jgi:hemoglobin
MQDNSAQFSPRTQANMPTQRDSPSLYERLGGIYSIACVVDDLIDRIMTDARLNANPTVNEAHHRVPPLGFKYLVTEMVGIDIGQRFNP